MYPKGDDIGTLTITDGVGTSVGVFYEEVNAQEGKQDLGLFGIMMKRIWLLKQLKQLQR